MDTRERIRELMKSRGWSAYNLAKVCNLSESTIANIFRRDSIPGIPTLEAICSGFGITLSEFFSENEVVELTDENKELLENWALLTAEQKKAVLQLIKSFH